MVTDFTVVIFNPSTATRVGHMVMASLETSAFVVAGVSAYYLLKKEYVDFARRGLGIALIMAALFAPLQVYMGDRSGVDVFRYQPAKLAAMEAHWDTNTTGGAPYTLFALPSPAEEKNRLEISIPSGLSLLVTRSLDGRVRGLKEFPREDRPNVSTLFWSFRFMVAIGFFFLLVMLWAAILWTRGHLFSSRPFLWTLLIIHPLGFVATELGWITTEAGRQPWLVYNLMRTAQGVSPIHAGNVLWSLGLFLIVLPVIGAVYFFYVLKALHRGPDLSSPIPPVQLRAGMKALGG